MLSCIVSGLEPKVNVYFVRYIAVMRMSYGSMSGHIMIMVTMVSPKELGYRLTEEMKLRHLIWYLVELGYLLVVPELHLYLIYKPNIGMNKEKCYG